MKNRSILEIIYLHLQLPVVLDKWPGERVGKTTKFQHSSVFLNAVTCIMNYSNLDKMFVYSLQ